MFAKDFDLSTLHQVDVPIYLCMQWYIWMKMKAKPIGIFRYFDFHLLSGLPVETPRTHVYCGGVIIGGQHANKKLQLSILYLLIKRKSIYTILKRLTLMSEIFSGNLKNHAW